MTTYYNSTAPGLFQKGGPGGPGRPKGRSTDSEYAAAIREGLPPERMLALMETALDLSIKRNSWRGVLAVVEFAVKYLVGKPR